MLGAIIAAGVASAGSCSCAATFADVVDAVEKNYAGYVVKLPDQRSREIYRQFRSLNEEDARNARNPEQCRSVIDAYLDFFADDDLFVGRVSSQSAAQAITDSTDAARGRQQTSAPELPKLKARWTPGKVEFRLRRETDLDPVEGLWRDAEGQLAIVHDDALDRGQYVAFRFRQHHFGGAGEILAFIRPASDGAYHIHYRDRNGVWQKTRARLNRETGILSFGNLGWQRITRPAAQTGEREDPSRAGEEVSQKAADPLAPVFRDLGSDFHYLSMPSFLPRFRESLQMLLARHREQFEKSNGLVIDLRGNSGGDPVYLPLMKYLLTGPVVRSEPNAVFASEWNIEYLAELREQLGEQGGYLGPVLDRMRADPGKLVPYLNATMLDPGTSQAGPKHVVVLQDRSVGGAAEAFLLQVKQSDKVVTMGEPSKGNIDYQQVNTRNLGCGAYRLSFGYPLYMRTRALPAESLDDRGIAPDVRLPSVSDDWVKYAKRWLRAAGEPHG